MHSTKSIVRRPFVDGAFVVSGREPDGGGQRRAHAHRAARAAIVILRFPGGAAGLLGRGDHVDDGVLDSGKETHQHHAQHSEEEGHLNPEGTSDNVDLIGNLVDISTKGIMVVSEKVIEPNTRYRLRMVLPDTVDGSKEVDFDAESRWCRNDANQAFYDTGFELLDPSMEFLDAVDRLVEDCLFKE